MEAKRTINQLFKMDFSMLIAMALLLSIGALFIYSAGYQSELTQTHSLYKRQFLWISVGLVVFIVVTLIDYRKLGNHAYVLFALSVLLLIAVYAFGTGVNGAKRWINLGVKVQPSEFAKIGSLLALAYYASKPGRNFQHRQPLFTAMAIATVPFLLIANQPDLGTAMVLLPMTMMILYVGGIPYRIIGLLSVIGVLCLPVGWVLLDDYQKARILVFFDPSQDPLRGGWNKMQSEIAVGSGGFSGKGYLKGTQNILGFLPRTVAPTDFIYSVIAEEMGFVGSALIVALYSVIFIAIARAALLAQDRFGRLLASGVLAMMFSHVLVNISMTVGLMPITGLPLPLISYGGSFTLSTMIALGLVQSVYIRRQRR